MTSTDLPTRARKRIASNVRAGLSRARDTKAWAILRDAVDAGVTYRVTGLAGEAAFFALLSLPPFVLGVIGVIGKLGTWLGQETVQQVRAWVVEQAGVLFTQDAIDRVVNPLMNDVLRDDASKVSIISLGFLLSLWSGSRALYVYVDLISVAYGLGEARGIVRTRLMSFGLYVVGLAVAIVVMPILVIGPTLLKDALPAQFGVLIDVLYWPVVIIGSVAFLTVLYHVSVPVRTKVYRELPGAVLALFLWIVCAAVLRAVLAEWFSPVSVYGSLAAPIAVLLWLYITALAVLIGAILNAEVDKWWPGTGRARPGDAEDTAVTLDAAATRE
ncbi:YihY/virulence factor BrkB family protein [Nonomuraea rhodomycinica]|uniref:YihY/virulence factor BrkB family protein n=1 Tax=Nonomuraea rhodomycinica TaxID=1712872 RepID=A0A7Y6MCE4_9ACTN|nr:YihY/virulence factor BrkB family protein [Nonomuraea rhodomycinica]NUW42707.1 YihY/virulence factor BrkB family protein [Nonomuraea rhodomycinica]